MLAAPQTSTPAMVTGLVAQDTSILLPLPKAASAQQHHLEQHPKGSSCCRQADSRVLFFFFNIYTPVKRGDPEGLPASEQTAGFGCLAGAPAIGTAPKPVPHLRHISPWHRKEQEPILFFHPCDLIITQPRNSSIHILTQCRREMLCFRSALPKAGPFLPFYI